MYNLDLLGDGNFTRTKLYYGTWKRELGNTHTAGKEIAGRRGGVWDVSAFQARRQGDVQVGCITAGKRPGKGRDDGYFNGEVSPGD